MAENAEKALSIKGVKFVLNDGTTLEVDYRGPWSAREQIAWEEHFRQSFLGVYRAQRSDADLADADSASMAQAFKVSWVLWFGWYRLRPQVAGRFSTFVDEQLADWDFIVEEVAADEPVSEPERAEPDVSLDPTSPPDGSQPPAVSIPEASPAL